MRQLLTRRCRAGVAGYSLLEVLCAMALLSLLLLGTLELGAVLLGRLQFAQARQHLSTRLENLQQLAQLRQHPCTQEIDTYAIKASSCGRILPEIRLRSVRATARFASISKQPTRFVAHANGTVSPGRVLLRNRHAECTLVISLRGALREYCK